MGSVHAVRMFLICLLLAGCNDGADGDQVLVRGIVHGIMQEQSVPLGGVLVTHGNTQVQTDAGGKVDLTIPGKEISLIKFEMTGFAPVVRKVDPQNAKLITLPVNLVIPNYTSQIDVTENDASIAGEDFILRFPAHSLVTADGLEPPGPIDAIITWIEGVKAPGYQPIPLFAADGSEITPLFSYGMVNINLSYNQQPVTLAAGSALKLSVKAQEDVKRDVAAFFGDMERGIWIREGEAEYLNNYYTIEITHLSWWNVDAFMKVDPLERACVNFVVEDPDGRPLPGVSVHITGENNDFWAQGSSDSDGTMCEERFPSGLKLYVTWGGYLSAQADDPATPSTYQEVTPSALGMSCGTIQCPTVKLILGCQDDLDCPSGKSCSPTGTCGKGSGSSGGEYDWIGTWQMESIDGQSTSGLGFSAVLVLTEKSLTETHTGGINCQTNGTIIPGQDRLTITLTSSTCDGVNVGGTRAAIVEVSDGGSQLSLTWEVNGQKLVYSRL